MQDEGTQAELESLKSGGQDALAKFFEQSSERLDRLIRLRMNSRLFGRVDSSDVLQEAYLVVARRLDEYLAKPILPPFLWLRSMTLQVLVDVHRRHLDAKARNAAIEVSLNAHPPLGDSSQILVAHLAANLTSPSEAVERDEAQQQLWKALEAMDSIDREILVMRHLEDLDNNQIAAILGLQKAAASNRYTRALKRLKEILTEMPPFKDSSADQ